ncbi:MAG: PTS lactose/cellobiose transporter subunit IIA [Lactobacillus sp.]|nr:PTS lactose/cellobiose transporter subunit IIA [Lactobacillus sp.]
MDQTVNDEALQKTMMLIINAGNAKGFAKEAIDAAKANDFDLADQKINQAQKSLVDAHNSQTEMITKEARGEHTPLSLLIVHSQDHLMTAITYIDLAKEIIEVYKKMNEKVGSKDGQ